MFVTYLIQKTSMVVYVLKVQVSSSKSPMLQSVFFFSYMRYTIKDTIHHISHKWAFKWQQFISTSSLNSYSAFITLK